MSKTESIKKGVAVVIGIPLFDIGKARFAEAEQRYLQAANRLGGMAVNASSETHVNTLAIPYV
jgi:hypothetical protein